MKKKIITSLINNIKKQNSKLTCEDLEIIEYGLESLYLTYTKIFVILTISIILGIFKETILMLLFYNIIRLFAFGMHAKGSISCLITSILLFIGGAYISIYLYIPLYLKIIFSIISIILISIYAPADTVKRPLINAKKRKIYKFLSITISIIITFLLIYYHQNKLSNFMLIGLIEETIMILPITYKISKLPYNNYKAYQNT